MTADPSSPAAAAPAPAAARPAATLQRRLFLVGSLLVAGLALSVVAFGDLGEDLVYFWDPSQMQAAGEDAVGATIRLGGVVKAGTVQWQPDANSLKFIVTDGKVEVPVEATGAPPQMFREGIGVVVEGTLTKSGVFTSDRLMVKHSNEYKAPEGEMSADERKSLYTTVEEL
jgi:cytochrome c-type biogenesis protein CcmE